MSHTSKTIGIDARMYGLEHAGIGRYVKNLITELGEIDNLNHYKVLLKSKYAESLDLGENFEKIVSNVQHYTLAEQLSFYKQIQDIKVDVFHFPHFNVPYLYSRPFVTTIHDLLWHQQTGSNVTTLGSTTYKIKYLGYKEVVKHAIERSGTILTPSEWVKNQILENYSEVESEKVRVIYEGVDGELIKKTSDSMNPDVPFDKFLIYVGSAYPHKNLELLVKSMHKVDKGVGLIIVSSRDVFIQKLQDFVDRENLAKRVKFLGYVRDEQLSFLMKESIALVQPSKSEGFGLTGLEAMTLGVPLIAAKAGAMPEIYADGAMYFDPNNVRDLEKAINKLIDDKALRKSLIKSGEKQAKKYSWKKMAEKTLDVYMDEST